ncbi:hypothetical protein B0H14DRAFT_2626994 [Mycena olivaceomarginata]|nr:hypothetical protein B0H14DRAFT_2626994 [Mycena olivaceomarginata]
MTCASSLWLSSLLMCLVSAFYSSIFVMFIPHPSLPVHLTKQWTEVLSVTRSNPQVISVLTMQADSFSGFKVYAVLDLAHEPEWAMAHTDYIAASPPVLKVLSTICEGQEAWGTGEEASWGKWLKNCGESRKVFQPQWGRQSFTLITGGFLIWRGFCAELIWMDLQYERTTFKNTRSGSTKQQDLELNSLSQSLLDEADFAPITEAVSHWTISEAVGWITTCCCQQFLISSQSLSSAVVPRHDIGHKGWYLILDPTLIALVILESLKSAIQALSEGVTKILNYASILEPKSYI